MAENMVIQLKGFNIIYIDDEQSVLDAVFFILKDFFNNIYLYNNPIEALNFYKQHQNDIDIIITDVSMPQMNGLELVSEIRKLNHTVPILISTAYSDSDFLYKAINMHISGYILKPVDAKQIMNSIIEALEPEILKKELVEINKKLEYKVAEKTRELRTILDTQDNLIAVVYNNIITNANSRFLAYFSIEELDEVSLNYVCNLFEKGDYYFSIKEKDANCIEELKKEFEGGDLLVKIKDKVFRISISSYELNGEHFVLSFTDITKLQEENSILLYLATHDSLTKLLNRRKFMEILEKEIDRINRNYQKLSLIMFDIDFFKQVNDNYGHDIGDEVLINLSNLISKKIRSTDYICRFGGEEFMLLLPETDGKNSETIANKLKDIIQNTKLSLKYDLNITCSFGVTEYIKDESVDSFIKRVDDALYISKNSGRNKVTKK